MTTVPIHVSMLPCIYTLKIMLVIMSTKGNYTSLSKVFYLSTDARKNCFKRSIKTYIKIASTCFGVIIIIMERTI
jgi:hypothetical protein